MAGPAVSSPCGYCAHPVPAGARQCARCGIRLVDITRHHPGYAPKEFVLDGIDRLGPQNMVRAAVGGIVLGAVLAGYRRLRKREA